MAGKLHKRRGEGSRLQVSGYLFGLLIVLSMLISAFALHPYYVSVTEMEYNAGKKEIEISGKVFIDDLEYALKQEFKTNVSILNEADKKRNNELLNSFFQKHLKLAVDGKPVAFEFVGFQREEEAIWSFMVVKNVKPFKTVTVFNDLLYSFREDEVNIVHFKNKNERKSYRLTFPDNKFSLSW